MCTMFDGTVKKFNSERAVLLMILVKPKLFVKINRRKRGEEIPID